MSSGMRKTVFNFNERVLSSDINQLQDYAARDLMELFRHALNSGVQDDLEAGANETEYASLDTPLRAEILGAGFTVQPQGGSLAVRVTGGVMMAINPDSDPKASNYKYIRDTGIPLDGVLAMTANSSGSIRIDVVECRPNATPRIVSDLRGIFNESTELFIGQTVTKETQTVLEYRIRLGTPGSGFPGAAAGWVPIAVASVPTGTTINDTITFWDVRPLLNDRSNALSKSSRDIQMIADGTQLSFDKTTDTSKLIVRGFVEGVNGRGRRIGGRIRRGTPGTDAEFVDLQLAANEDGTSFPANGFGYVYLATPFGLPRWARYTDGPTGRVPRSPRGIPMLSYLSPRHLKAFPTGTFNLPALTGLGTVDETDVTCIAAVPIGSTGVKDFYSMVVKGREHSIWSPTLAASTNLDSVAAASLSTTAATWVLTPGVNYPTNARRVRLKVQLVWQIIATDGAHLDSMVLQFATANPGVKLAGLLLPGTTFSNFTGSSQNFRYEWVGWVPVASLDYPAAAVDAARLLTVNFVYLRFATGTTAPLSGGIQIDGWEIP